MGLTPAEFWAMSWREFSWAAEGFAEFHSGGDDGKVKPPTKAEADEIIRQALEMERKQGLK